MVIIHNTDRPAKYNSFTLSIIYMFALINPTSGEYMLGCPPSSNVMLINPLKVRPVRSMGL